MLFKNAKPATGHICVLIIALLINILSLVTTIIFANKYAQLSELGWRVYLFPFVFVLGVLVEIIVYWKGRFEIRVKANAWMHCLLVCNAFLLPPVVNFVTAYWADNFGIENYGRVIKIINVGEPYFFWSCILLAHYFFYKVLVEIKATTVVKNKTQQENDLLSDFHL
jgi:hypothetical protein